MISACGRLIAVSDCSAPTPSPRKVGVFILLHRYPPEPPPKVRAFSDILMRFA
jgi:hypothetical protein